MPHDVGLRVAVQQQDRGARVAAADERIDPYPSRGKSDSLEQLGQRDSHMTLFALWDWRNLASTQPQPTGRRLKGAGGYMQAAH